jgi:hypothetical protein
MCFRDCTAPSTVSVFGLLFFFIYFFLSGMRIAGRNEKEKGGGGGDEQNKIFKSSLCLSQTSLIAALCITQLTNTRARTEENASYSIFYAQMSVV